MCPGKILFINHIFKSLKVYIKHFDGPITFGFASRFQAMTRALPEVDVVIIRMKKIPYIDQSGM
jgi:SulP family sulfate permease